VEDFSIPGWAGPVVGALVGGVFGFCYSLQGNSFSLPFVIGMSIAGGAAGCLLFVVDLFRKRRDPPKD
jgi:hypothetical protein